MVVFLFLKLFQGTEARACCPWSEWCSWWPLSDTIPDNTDKQNFSFSEILKTLKLLSTYYWLTDERTFSELQMKRTVRVLCFNIPQYQQPCIMKMVLCVCKQSISINVISKNGWHCGSLSKIGRNMPLEAGITSETVILTWAKFYLSFFAANS